MKLLKKECLFCTTARWWGGVVVVAGSTEALGAVPGGQQCSIKSVPTRRKCRTKPWVGKKIHTFTDPKKRCYFSEL